MRVAGKREWPLVFFTALTQTAVGAFIWWVLALLQPGLAPDFRNGPFVAILLAFILALLGFGTLAAGLHLSQPLRVAFATCNWRSSWLSREALLGISFGLLVLGLWFRRVLGLALDAWDVILIIAGLLSGLSLIYGIARLYMLRTVPAWNHAGTPITFLITSLLLGLVLQATIWQAWLAWNATGSGLQQPGWAGLPAALICLSSLQLLVFGAVLLHLSQRGGAASASLRLLGGELRLVLIARVLSALLAIILLSVSRPLLTWIALGLLLLSELLGRYLFYAYYRRVGI